MSLLVDGLSMPLVLLTSVLVGIVGTFSVRYMHRERGFFRFFLLLHLFAFGALLTLTAGSFDLLLIGWELVGITSVLFVAFFDERVLTGANALRVFATYRLADLGLLLAIFVLHASAGSSEYARHISWRLAESECKSFGRNCSWTSPSVGGIRQVRAASVQRMVAEEAMEGPTPSSAIFYGSIAVHLGAYLLLRSEAVFAASPIASGMVIAVGTLTAIVGTLSHRVVSDAKTSIAYAVMTQLGVIFVEIGLGFPRLALVHIVSHMVVRTLQFLRAPSALHDYHRLHAAAAGDLEKTGGGYREFVPKDLDCGSIELGWNAGSMSRCCSA